MDSVLGFFLPPALLTRLFASWDRAGSGAADVSELTACVSVCCKGSIEERIEYAFKLFDHGKTGKLTSAQVCGNGGSESHNPPPPTHAGVCMDALLCSVAAGSGDGGHRVVDQPTCRGCRVRLQHDGPGSSGVL